MCVTANAAKLSKTIVYAGTARKQGKRVHVIGYQNTAVNLAHGANCMILHIPASAPMGPDNMVDTSACPQVLEILVELLTPSRSIRGGPVSGSARANVHVFKKGCYTVVLANRWDLAHQALDQVPPNQRPEISSQLLRFYGERFPGWHLALCCFDSRETITAEPLLWWYEPLYPNTLMAPGLDAHTGAPPNLSQPVERDHSVIFGFTEDDADLGADLIRLPHDRFSYYPNDVTSLIPTYATHAPHHRPSRNGDFLLDLDELRQQRGHDHSFGTPGIRVGLLGA